MTYHPRQTTERESDGSWEDCTWATGVMLENAAYAASKVPATRAEYEALRVAGGDGPAEHTNDGSNYGQLCTGMDARYGWRPTIMAGRDWGTVWHVLDQPGIAMGVQGKLSALSTHLRRWDPSSSVAHSVLVENDGIGLWWMNPLAPADFPGEYVIASDVQRFYEGLAGAGSVVYTRVGSRALPDTDTKEELVKKLNSNGLVADDGRPLFLLPCAEKQPFTTVDGVTGAFSGPANVPVLAIVDSDAHQYLVLVTTSVGWADGVDRQTPVIVHSLTSRVANVKAPDSTPYSADDLKAKYAAGRESFRADVDKLP